MKPTNIAVKRFKLLESKIKKLNEEREEIRQAFLQTGSFATTDYMVVVEDMSREQISGMTEFRKTGLEDLIRKKGLVKAVSFRRVLIREKE